MPRRATHQAHPERFSPFADYDATVLGSTEPSTWVSTEPPWNKSTSGCQQLGGFARLVAAGASMYVHGILTVIRRKFLLRLAVDMPEPPPRNLNAHKHRDLDTEQPSGEKHTFGV